MHANTLTAQIDMSNRNQMNIAVTAIGSAPHLAGVAVEQATGAKWQYVPYKGGAQAIADTVGGTAQILMNGMLATLPHVQSGKLKVLGVSKSSRMPLIGDVPTIAEQGVPGFEAAQWYGLAAPAGTPGPVVERLNAECARIRRGEKLRPRLAAEGAEAAPGSPEQFREFIAAERARWGELVRRAGVRPD